MEGSSSRHFADSRSLPKVNLKPELVQKITESRLGSVNVPRSLRTVLLDFTLAFLLENPKDVLKFGFQYFKKIRQRKKTLKSHGRIFEDEHSENDSDEIARNRVVCYKCKEEVRPCQACQKLHRVCHSCSKQMKKTPSCAMATAPPQRVPMAEGDAPFHPHRQSRRDCIFSEGLGELEAMEWDPPVYEKTDEQAAKLLGYLTSKTLFKELELAELDKIVRAMFLRSIVADEVVIRQGRGGDFFYIIEKGEYRAYVNDDDGNTRVLTNYDGHGSFGELALMYNVPRYCSVKALTAGSVWVLDRDTFRKTVIQGAMKKREFHIALLRSVPMLQILNDFEILNVADSLEIHHYSVGEKIIVQGDEAEGMFFIARGKVNVFHSTENAPEVALDTLESGAYFGELALIEDQKRAATVVAATDVTVAFLQREAFERLLGPCQDIMNRKIVEYNQQIEEMARKAESEDGEED